MRTASLAAIAGGIAVAVVFWLLADRARDEPMPTAPAPAGTKGGQDRDDVGPDAQIERTPGRSSLQPGEGRPSRENPDDEGDLSPPERIWRDAARLLRIPPPLGCAGSVLDGAHVHVAWAIWGLKETDLDALLGASGENLRRLLARPAGDEAEAVLKSAWVAALPYLASRRTAFAPVAMELLQGCAADPHEGELVRFYALAALGGMKLRVCAESEPAHFDDLDTLGFEVDVLTPLPAASEPSRIYEVNSLSAAWLADPEGPLILRQVSAAPGDVYLRGMALRVLNRADPDGAEGRLEEVPANQWLLYEGVLGLVESGSEAAWRTAVLALTDRKVQIAGVLHEEIEADLSLRADIVESLQVGFPGGGDVYGLLRTQLLPPDPETGYSAASVLTSYYRETGDEEAADLIEAAWSQGAPQIREALAEGLVDAGALYRGEAALTLPADPRWRTMLLQFAGTLSEGDPLRAALLDALGMPVSRNERRALLQDELSRLWGEQHLAEVRDDTVLVADLERKIEEAQAALRALGPGD